MENKTTAIYSNRREDKFLLEAKLKLNEFGDNTTKFMLGDKLFAIGYTRIVYGDHGPYIEFDVSHIKCKLVAKYGGDATFNVPKEPKYYYYWYRPVHCNAKVYFQLKTVRGLANAPRRNDGKRSMFARVEGYADYKIGMIYVDPYEFSNLAL